MEQHILKLTAQLGIVALGIWVIASIMGEQRLASLTAKTEANDKIKHQLRFQSNVNYAPPVVVAPKAEGAAIFQPVIGPTTRY